MVISLPALLCGKLTTKVSLGSGSIGTSICPLMTAPLGDFDGVFVGDTDGACVGLVVGDCDNMIGINNCKR